ncbi:translation initiation factor eIF-2B subunit delta [Diachasma alloeum]|uniref:translation initiation factor eIF-2B subunit delta n=1 Tax=Diachasma alloeum TaxID=454923 RepID=UPI00073811C1|nr:translation initiation factor eIF-2B subunit delta [Diachasma alloeum]
MDEKNSKETTKITRSQARHLRRKRLINARRSPPETTPPESQENHRDPAKPLKNQSPPVISKSKARRLRKKSNHTTSPSPPSASFDTSEITSTISTSTEEIRPDPEKNSQEILNTKRNPQELLNNEKNLKITESLSRSKPNDSNTELIIKKSPNIQPSDLFRNSFRDDISHGLALSHDSPKSPAQSNKEIISPKTVAPREIKMNAEGKTREEIKAEREAKKAAKAAAKNKSKGPKQNSEVTNSSKNPPKPSAANHLQENCLSVPESKPTLNNVMSDEEVEKEISNVGEKFSNLTVSDFVVTPHQTTVSREKKIKQEGKSADEGKSKAQLREERRLKQEAQRAAKEAQKVAKAEVKAPKLQKVEGKLQEKVEKSQRKIKKVIVKDGNHEVGLFKHLYHERGQAFVDTPPVNSHVHPAIVRLGVQYASKIVVGSNARCIAFLAAVKEMIQDFERPSQADFTRGLEASLQEHSAYLHHCRPMAVTMHNALRHLKWQISQLDSKISDNEAKTKLGTAIDTYIKEQILLAGQAISIAIQSKISNGDVILTCSYSSLIQKILCEAHDKGKKFRVVILDGRPFLEGKELLRRLAKYGIECSYGRITQVSNIITKEGVSKVLLGVHAIFANGAIMSRLGTAQIALMAKAFNIPVLFACETYKTCERVQTDSIVNNEIGDPNELAIGSTALANWKAQPNLNLLNLTYDVTPPELITAVVTELGILPCTSVPVILRMKSSEI